MKTWGYWLDCVGQRGRRTAHFRHAFWPRSPKRPMNQRPKTGELMTAFFKNLKGGMGKAAALRAAQAETRAKYLHPYYWAAFVLNGAPGAAMPGQ